MSTQERIDLPSRSGRPEPAASWPASGRPGGDRLPRPPGRRRPGLAVVAVLLIVLGAAVAGLLATRIDNRVPVLVARHQIAVGQQISSDDLAVAQVASSGLSTIPAADSSQIEGRYATGTIPAGRLLEPDMFGSTSLLVPGKVAIGVSLAVGRYPASGLQSGDVVEAIQTASTTGKGVDPAKAGEVIATDITVGTVQVPGSSVFGSSGNSNYVITLILAQAEAPAVATAEAQTQLSLALVTRGGSTESTGGG